MTWIQSPVFHLKETHSSWRHHYELMLSLVSAKLPYLFYVAKKKNTSSLSSKSFVNIRVENYNFGACNWTCSVHWHLPQPMYSIQKISCDFYKRVSLASRGEVNIPMLQTQRRLVSSYKHKCVCSNANPLHYYVLRVPRKVDRWRYVWSIFESRTAWADHITCGTSVCNVYWRKLRLGWL